MAEQHNEQLTSQKSPFLIVNNRQHRLPRFEDVFNTALKRIQELCVFGLMSAAECFQYLIDAIFQFTITGYHQSMLLVLLFVVALVVRFKFAPSFFESALSPVVTQWSVSTQTNCPSTASWTDAFSALASAGLLR